MGEINKKKYKNAILYFIENCNNKHLGATKLNKLLYYLDFISYRDREKSITADTYIHEVFGPIPSRADEMLSELKEEEKIHVDFDTEYKIRGKYSFRNIKKPASQVFDAYEKRLLRKICKTFLYWSTDKVVTQTHLEAPWFYSKPYDVVDYKHSKDIDILSP